jgi:hypothetical protein
MIIYVLLKALVALVFGKRRKQSSNNYQRPPQPKQPETQHERIIEYQKKNFESSDIEDADFEEIKDVGNS